MRLKKGLSLLLATALSVSGIAYAPEIQPVQAAQTAQSTVKSAKSYGDMNQDGQVALADAQVALKGALKIMTLTKEQIKIGDIDSNGNVQLADAQRILKMALKIEKLIPLPVETSLEVVVEGTNDYGSIITEENTLKIQGTTEGNESLKSISAVCVDKEGQNQKVTTISCTKNSWSLKAEKLDFGANVLSLTAVGENGTIAKKEVTIYRNSSEVKVTSDVVAFLPESEDEIADIQAISENLYQMNYIDQGTEDAADDEYELIVDESNPLCDYIDNGDIKENEIIYIPPNEYFMTGLTFRYTSMDDESSSFADYDAETQEVIHGKAVTMTEMLDGEGYISSTSLDAENPVAFVYMPGGTDVKVQGEELVNTIQEYKTEFSFGDSDSIKRAGFQWQNLLSFNTKQTIEVDDKDDRIKGEIALGFKDVVLFDEDGSKETEDDRIVLDGTLGLKDIKPIFGCEWNNYLKLPQQLIATIEYKENCNVKATFGGKLGSMSDVLESFKLKGYENDTKLLGDIEATGVDLSDTFLLGAVGLQYGTDVKIGNIRTIKDKSKVTGLNPILVLTFYLELDGSIKTNVSVEYDYTAYVKKGVNLQEKGYVGAFGTCEENKGTMNVDVAGYQVNIYDIKGKSEDAPDEKPESTITLAAEGTAEAMAGVGVGVGLMTYGVMPAFVKAGVRAEAEASMKGSIKFHYPYEDDVENEEGNPSFVDSLDADANVKLRLQIKAIAEAAIKLHIKDEEGLVQFNAGIEKEFGPAEYTLAEWIFSSTQVQGQVLEEGTTTPIAGATVLLEKRSTANMGNSKYRQVITDENGKFKLNNCADGTYVLKVVKDGYTTYENAEFKVEGNVSDVEISLKKADDDTQATEKPTSTPTETPDVSTPAPEVDENFDKTAHGAVVESGTCGENANWMLYADGMLYIYGTGSVSNSPWRDEDVIDKVKQVYVASGIEEITSWGFGGCTSLTCVRLNEGLTEIAYNTFSGCENLEKINIPNSVKMIYGNACSDCPTTMKIYGTAGSFAQQYANENNYQFIAQ